jgi:hypothetical protein
MELSAEYDFSMESHESPEILHFYPPAPQSRAKVADEHNRQCNGCLSKLRAMRLVLRDL